MVYRLQLPKLAKGASTYCLDFAYLNWKVYFLLLYLIMFLADILQLFYEIFSRHKQNV